MSNNFSNSNSYIRIPDSLLNDERFIGAWPEHQMIFIRFIRLAAFRPMEHNINGNIIILQPGQLCYSFRKIAELCGKKFTKNHVSGAIRYFSKFDFLRQEVRHKKSIITITHTETYNLISKLSQTTSQTKVRQGSDIKEDRIEEIEEVSILSNDNKDTGDESINENLVPLKKIRKKSEKPKIEKIQVRENVLLTQDQIDALRLKHSPEFIDLMLNKLDSYKGATGKYYKSDYHLMKEGGWVFDGVLKELNQQKQVIPQEESKKIESLPSTEAVNLLEIFNESLKKNTEAVDFPEISEAYVFDELLQKFPEEKIRSAIRYAHSDHFWRPNTHTPKKIKEHLPRLLDMAKTRPPPGAVKIDRSRKDENGNRIATVNDDKF